MCRVFGHTTSVQLDVHVSVSPTLGTTYCSMHAHIAKRHNVSAGLMDAGHRAIGCDPCTFSHSRSLLLAARARQGNAAATRQINASCRVYAFDAGTKRSSSYNHRSETRTYSQLPRGITVHRDDPSCINSSYSCRRAARTCSKILGNFSA